MQGVLATSTQSKAADPTRSRCMPTTRDFPATSIARQLCRVPHFLERAYSAVVLFTITYLPVRLPLLASLVIPIVMPAPVLD